MRQGVSQVQFLQHISIEESTIMAIDRNTGSDSSYECPLPKEKARSKERL